MVAIVSQVAWLPISASLLTSGDCSRECDSQLVVAAFGQAVLMPASIVAMFTWLLPTVWSRCEFLRFTNRTTWPQSVGVAFRMIQRSGVLWVSSFVLLWVGFFVDPIWEMPTTVVLGLAVGLFGSPLLIYLSSLAFAIAATSAIGRRPKP